MACGWLVGWLAGRLAGLLAGQIVVFSRMGRLDSVLFGGCMSCFKCSSVHFVFVWCVFSVFGVLGVLCCVVFFPHVLKHLNKYVWHIPK